MDITKLKSGFWGYKKNHVCEYIAEMNEQFSKKLMETIKDYDRQIVELNAKINRLEAENSALQKECSNVTQVIVDAKKFSDELRAKAEAEDKEFRDRNMDYNNEQMQRINTFCMGIDKIRDSARTLMASIDKELEYKKEELSALKSGLEELAESEEGAIIDET